MAVVAKTRKQVADDVELRLTQGKPSGDLEVTKTQINRWVDIARDRFVADFLLKNGKYDGFFVPPEYVTIEKALALTAVASTDEDEYKCTVVQPILGTPLNDYGLVRVRTKVILSPFTHTLCRKVDRITLEDIKRMEFTAPSATSPVVYREGQDIYFVGLAASANTLQSATVEYVESMVGSDVTTYSISGAHVEDVTTMATEIGMKQLGIMIVDPVNDGDQNPPQSNNRR